MTILTIITNANDHTVYLKEPIKNFQFIKLVSCSLLQFLDKSQGKWPNNFN